MALPKSFFRQSTIDVARKLLGCVLISETEEGRTSGIVVETEAYLTGDPAAHSFNGKTARNAKMFGSPGHAYIYLIYGIHYCFNVVTEQEGIGEAVLIRALEPLDGIELMMKRRKLQKISQLCNGPAKLVDALGITIAQNGIFLGEGPLRLDSPRTDKLHTVDVSSRIGISKGAESLYRYSIAGNNFVSRPVSRS